MLRPRQGSGDDGAAGRQHQREGYGDPRGADIHGEPNNSHSWTGSRAD